MSHDDRLLLELKLELKQRDYPRYLWLMLAPPQLRPDFLALLSLNLELAGIPAKVTENMLGHIRYSWWQEGFEMLANNEAQARNHPLFELWQESAALQVNGNQAALELIALHRGHFEDHPKSCLHDGIKASEDLLYQRCSQLIEAASPEHLLGWQRKIKIIGNQKMEHVKPTNIWLMARLLMS